MMTGANRQTVLEPKIPTRPRLRSDRHRAAAGRSAAGAVIVLAAGLSLSGCHIAGHEPDFSELFSPSPAIPGTASTPPPAPIFPEPATMPLAVPVVVPEDIRKRSSCAQRSEDNLNQRLLCRGGSITVRELE